ncbi:hypothetical protein [Leptothoe sp. PORK10 BA2]|uniref:hypothetical protein n=1 Tax=Leptothoe sp. PORK10 BA2 TaxID=3110254 RepID=UPI002B20F5F4|nr:hypothetical protein [Leptothoe sp. PORK10 BA2]MEA5462483.1 hypothetical protein [Leptothoe sp. PORK10 BA2]
MSGYLHALAHRLSQTALGLSATAVTLGGLSGSVQAQELLDNQGIRLAVDTVVEFEFLESNGSYRSVFGILNLETGEKFPLYGEVKESDQPQPVNRPSTYQDDSGSQNRDDFYGSPGITVPQPRVEFRFVANTDYSFYLESSFSEQPAGTLYSTSNLNMGSRDYARFDGQLEDVIQGGLLLRWEDTGSLLVGDINTDYDYDDFIIRIGGSLRWDGICESEDALKAGQKDLCQN